MSSLTSASRRFRQSDSGAALVEAAIVTPIFLLLAFGVLELGIYLWQWNTATKAVQLGARYAVTSDPVARGDGLTTSPVTGPLGTSCRPDDFNPCFRFKVVCTSSGCSGGELYQIDTAAFSNILAQMRRVFPDLGEEHVRISYESNGLGFIGFPNHVPNNITVEIIERQYDFVALRAFLSWTSVRIRASATLTSEDLAT